MVTDINPIFGLPLVGMVEWVAIAILISVAVTGGLSYWNIRQTKMAMEWQAKIASMNIRRELDGILKEQRFKKVEAYIYGESSAKPDGDSLERYLNNLNSYAMDWNEGTFSTKHVTEAYRILLVKIRNNDYIQDFITKKEEEYEQELYTSLKKLWCSFK